MSAAKNRQERAIAGLVADRRVFGPWRRGPESETAGPACGRRHHPAATGVPLNPSATRAALAPPPPLSSLSCPAPLFAAPPPPPPPHPPPPLLFSLPPPTSSLLLSLPTISPHTQVCRSLTPCPPEYLQPALGVWGHRSLPTPPPPTQSARGGGSTEALKRLSTLSALFRLFSRAMLTAAGLPLPHPHPNLLKVGPRVLSVRLCAEPAHARSQPDAVEGGERRVEGGRWRMEVDEGRRVERAELPRLPGSCQKAPAGTGNRSRPCRRCASPGSCGGRDCHSAHPPLPLVGVSMRMERERWRGSPDSPDSCGGNQRDGTHVWIGSRRG